MEPIFDRAINPQLYVKKFTVFGDDWEDLT
jgi:hypothetical protein